MAAVLLLAYRRHQNVNQILNLCASAGVDRVYVHIDGAKDSNAINDVELTKRVVSNFSNKKKLTILTCFQESNIGCAVSMIKSCNFVLQIEERLIVLEDDCIPTQPFFEFMGAYFTISDSNSRIGVACGPQFSPKELGDSQWFMSRYPFHWGWGITKKNWQLIVRGLLSPEKIRKKDVFESHKISELIYWNAGSRRALEGYADIWDTLFVREMLRNDLFALLPANNLIKNVGNDKEALHTSKDGEWTNYPVGTFEKETLMPKCNSFVDRWIRDEYFGISIRHIFTTKITLILDRLYRSSARGPLARRVQEATVNFS